MPLNPIDLEIVTEGLISIVREMRQTIFRTAHSPVIADAQDFSCALFNADGEMVAQGRDMPGHVIAMPASVKEIFDDFRDEFRPGDLYLVNDPYRGGSHLNDVTLISPVFVDGNLFLFPCVRMHWADIGGMTPGSVSGQATEILQEGLRIPPIRLIEAGRPNAAAYSILFANVRMADERRGDLESSIAACHTAERRLRELVTRYGRQLILDCVAANMDRTERRLRQRIRDLPDGTYHYEDYLDLYTDGGYDPALVRCALTVAADQIVADFRGSSPQVAAVVNSSLAMTTAGVFIAVKSALDPGGLVNHGAFRPLTVHTEPGTVVHVTYPAPANAHSEVRKRVISAVMAALSQVAPDLIAADQFGTTFQNLIGGVDEHTGRPYLYYDYPAGGNGGFLESDGPSAMNPVDLGDISTIQSVERLETEIPIRIDFCEFRAGSGGDGRHRGGLGTRRSTRLLASTGAYSVQTDRTTVPPYGLALGGPGAATTTYLLRDGQRIDFDTPGKVAGYPMRDGDVLVMESAGGGGWGDPLTRDPDQVATDVAEGYLTVDEARERYGVTCDDVGGHDPEATDAHRRQSHAARCWLQLTDTDQPASTGRRGRQRVIYVHPDALPAGALVELHATHPAPLRAWVRHDIGVARDQLAVDADGLRILGADNGDRCLVRVLRAAHTMTGGPQ
ncbi:hydantoinase B/oxoprolinase family protein [Micromonospora sp. NBC_01813]|uniref:hydantoinase B/oxoprolinase family protein n=1 Tax=Micromonospora sp. NBC_01813 TaxID=2975988 RepID=UPI002DD8254C|nr:hydantoinase B/oxoprolinase family protein [Micromonospora sp. NBC_01813]WSA10401.1 hydantoinase B/oxoprolinase family protein [Micromonospora sp. NBC_01813]